MFSKGKAGKRLVGICVVLLTVVYLFATSVLAAVVAKQTSTVTYEALPYASNGYAGKDLYELREAEDYPKQYGMIASNTETINVYTSKEKNTDATAEFALASHYGAITLNDHAVPSNAVRVEAIPYASMYQGLDKVTTATTVTLSDGTQLTTEAVNTYALKNGQTSATYTVAPRTAGEYYIYVYHTEGNVPEVKYNVVSDYTSANLFDAPADWSSLTFEKVSDCWYRAKVTVSQISWSCYAAGYDGNTGTSATTDQYRYTEGDYTTFTSNSVNFALNLNPDKYYYNRWTMRENSFDTLLALNWSDPNVRIGTIGKPASLTIQANTDHGTVEAFSAYGEPVKLDGTANSLAYAPVYVVAEPTDADPYTFVMPGASFVGAVGAYKYNFTADASLTTEWEAPAPLPGVTLTAGGSTLSLDFAKTVNGEMTFLRETDNQYTFAMSCPEGVDPVEIRYTVAGETSAEGSLTAESPTLTVNSRWNDTVVTFKATNANGIEKTITFTAKATNPDRRVAQIGEKYYAYLEDAILEAVSGDKIVLLANYNMVADSPDPDWVKDQAGYTVKNGVTLLIPYDSAGTLITTDMANYVSTNQTHSSGTLFRKLTIPTGVQLTAAKGGSINVGSAVSRQMVGSVGPYAAIEMEGDANITVKDGGTLYAWGYIRGSGTVTVESNGTVYEPFSVLDYTNNAGTALSLFSNNFSDNKLEILGKASGGYIFPMRAFYVRNVEVLMTIHSGGREYAFYHLYGESVGNHSGNVLFIGGKNDSDCIFKLKSDNGKIEKAFVNGKQIVKVDGDSGMNSLKVSVKVITEVALSSNNTSGVPLPSGFDVTLVSGTLTMGENYIITEGSTVRINHGATLDTNGKNLFVLSAEDDPGAVNVNDIYGNAYTLVNKNACMDINGTLIASGGFYVSAGKTELISSEGTGVVRFSGNFNVMESKLLNSSVAGVVPVKQDRSTSKEVPVLPANLKNADGSYIQIAKAANNYIYNAENGKWECENHTLGDWTEVTPPAIGVEGLKQATCSVCGAVITEPVPALTAVAQYNGNPYATLTEAVAAAKGKKVQLLTAITEETVISQAAAIYKNGFTANVVAGDGYAVTERKDAYIVWKDVDVVTYAANTLDADSKVFLNLKFFIPSGMSDDVVISWTKENYIKKDGSLATFEDSCTVGELRATGIDDSGRYVLSQDFASGEMSGNMTVHFKDGESELQIYNMKDDKWFENGFVRSILDYSTQALGSSNPKMVNLSRGMMNFASYAKAYFRISYEDTAKQDPADLLGGPLTDEMEALANLWDTSDTTYDNKYSGADLGILNNPNVANEKISQSLVLDSDTNIKTFFYLAEGTNIEDLTFTLTYIEDKVTKQKTLDAYKDGNRYCVEIEHIPVAYWNYGYKITVTSQAAEGEFVIETSVLAWAKNAINKSSATNTNNMGKAMFLYNKYACDYFNQK